MDNETKIIDTLKTLAALLSIAYVMLILVSIVYQNLLLKVFKINGALFFGIQDYLISSIGGITSIVIAVAIGTYMQILITAKIDSFERLKSKFLRLKLKETWKKIFCFCVLLLIPIGIVKVAYENYASSVEIIRDTIWMIVQFFIVLMIVSIIPVLIPNKLWRKIPIKVFIILISIFVFVAGMFELVILQKKMIEEGEDCNYQITTNYSTFDKACIITQTSDYLALYLEESKILVIPKDLIVKIEVNKKK